MKKSEFIKYSVGFATLIASLSASHVNAAYDSGSICGTSPGDAKCLGAFAPSVNTEIQLPADGVLHYSTFTVPGEVTVKFKKNAANTPVVILASGDVTIQGKIDVSGSAAPECGAAGDGNVGDDGQPGVSGPGGGDGGFGGLAAAFGGVFANPGGSGRGPGGGPGLGLYYNTYPLTGYGGSFYSNASDLRNYGYTSIPPAKPYGQSNLLPIIGGSGGGGGTAGSTFNGCGGGGGGGAILIASSGTLAIGNASNGNYGKILAMGGNGGSSAGTGCGGGGGAGSGGAIKLVAETVKSLHNDYLLNVSAGTTGSNPALGALGWGSQGFVRIEANTMLYNGYISPDSNSYTFGTPGKLFVPNSPTISITKIGGVSVTTDQNGKSTVSIPEGTTMPLTVEVSATNIPRGTIVNIIAAGTGESAKVSTNALDGLSDAATTASAQVSFATGRTTLLATATFTVTEIIAMGLPKYQGEYVAKVRVESGLGGKSRVVYITASGKEFVTDGAGKSRAV